MVGVDAVPGVGAGDHRGCSALRPAPVSGVDVTIGGAEAAEDAITSFTEEQLLVGMRTTLGDNLSSLPRHQVSELVDKEGRR